MKYTKKAVVTAACFMLAMVFLIAAQPVMAQSVAKVGVVDIQRALNESKKGKSAKSKLKSKFDRYQKELTAIESRLNKEQADLEKQAPMLSPEAKYKKEKELRRKVRDFQDKYKDYTDQIKREEYEATQPVLNDIIRITRALGKEQGYSLIMEFKAGVIYAPEALDLTKEVMKRLDAGK